MKGIDMSKDATRLVIGVPSGDMIHADFAMSLVNLTLQSYMEGCSIAIINQKSSIIEVGRNQIVEQAVLQGADYLLMLDSDMLFPADIFLRMKKWDKAVVCCDAVQRRAPYNQVVQLEDGSKIDHENCVEDIVKLKGASTACMLIDMHKLAGIEGPWFVVEWKDNKFLGEDYYFTKLLKEKGIDIWCDVALSKRIGHMGNKAFYVKS